ncbi:MAG: glycosyltransferase family 9 protein [Nitrospira sp.]|nr:glycosyltransferase family 9 protein [Nitrospira sp.]
MKTKILVIHPGSLGDVVLSLPALHALKRAYPTADLDLIGNPSILELLRRRFYTERVISIDRADVTCCLAGLENFSGPWTNTIREYSLVVNWLGDKGEEFSRYMNRIGVQRLVSSQPISQKTTYHHRINIFLESLSPLQIPTPFLSPRVFPSLEDKSLGQEVLVRSGMILKGRPILAIHPGSGGRYKCWDFTRFVEVSHQAKKHLGFQPLFILGPAERRFVPRLRNSLDCDLAILDSVPLPILAGALTWCGAYLGNDSGVTHLAAALGIPTVAMFGPTDPHLWGPVGRHVRVISRRIEGRHAEGNICQGCGCLDLVSAEDVIQALAEIALDYSAAIC